MFCSDGTSNTAKDRTNVFQVYSMLRETPGQIKAYDRGVGTRFGNVLRGCAFGVGLHLNILDGFRFLSRNYREGDRIYLFGYSRGAYTVRSLASMICLCGLAPGDFDESTVRHFWKAYCANRRPEEFRKRMAGVEAREALVEAVCVWDTVGSIGMQTRTENIRKKLAHRYHRMTVHGKVRRIYHAVSIDERRTQFFPHLLFGQVESPDTVTEEVWFPGVHSDVGGCYRDGDPSLGDVALSWMISKVDGELEFHEGAMESLRPDPLGRMHNREGGLIFSFFRKRNRPVRRGSVLHRSVLQRIASPPKSYHQHREPSGNYCPLALNFCSFSRPPDFGIPGNYKIEDESFPPGREGHENRA